MSISEEPFYRKRETCSFVMKDLEFEGQYHLSSDLLGGSVMWVYVKGRDIRAFVRKQSMEGENLIHFVCSPAIT